MTAKAEAAECPGSVGPCSHGECGCGEHCHECTGVPCRYDEAEDPEAVYATEGEYLAEMYMRSKL